MKIRYKKSIGLLLVFSLLAWTPGRVPEASAAVLAGWEAAGEVSYSVTDETDATPTPETTATPEATATPEMTPTPIPVNEPASVTMRTKDGDPSEDVTSPVRMKIQDPGKQLLLSVLYTQGETKEVDPDALPEGVSLRFVSSDPSKVSVSEKGYITPVSVTTGGAVTITVYYEHILNENGVSRTVSLTGSRGVLVLKPAESITMKYTMQSIYPDKVVSKKKSLAQDATLNVWIGDTIKLYSTVLPADTTDKTLNFVSSDSKLVSVTKKGTITVKYMGDVTITASSIDAPEVEFRVHLHCYKKSINVVSDLGAVANDGTSDLEIMRKALAQARYLKADDVLTIDVPSGTFDVDGQMTIYSNTRLRLASGTVIKRAAGCGKSTMLRSSIDSSIGGYNQIKNVTVSGGVWDANADGSETSDLLYFGHGQDITVQDTEVKNTCGEHLIEYAGVNRGVIKNVKLSGFVLPKTQTDYTHVKEAIQLDYCSANSTPAMVPYDYTPSKNITITGCEIHDYMCGIGTHGWVPSAVLENITIQNNTFYNIANICVDARNFKNLTVADNTAKNSHEFLYSENSTGTVKGNTITAGKVSNPGVKWLNTSNGMELLGSEFTVVSNVIKGMKSNGMYIGTSSKVTAKKNKIKKCKKYGIYSYRAEVTFKSNTISGNSLGLYYTDKEVTIKFSDDIRAYGIELEKEYEYTGSQIKPIDKVPGLKKKYYTISYKNNKKRGTATVIIKGKGKVKKTLKLTFEIV